jgi:O-antigen ligase
VTFVLHFLGLRVHKVGKPFKVLLLVGLLAGAYMNLDKLNLERYETLGSLEEDYNFGEGGRVDNWTRGLRLVAERPLTGVGVASFAAAVGWQRKAENMSTKWSAAHSVYIEILTETGVIGGGAYFLLIFGALRTFDRLRRSSTAFPDPELGILPGLLLVGLGAQMVAGAFLSQAYSMFFTLTFAMSAALNRIAAQTQTTPVGQASK